MEYIKNSDFGYTVAASILTSIGLGTNELPQMIGGMLISPIANPIVKMMDTGLFLTNIIQLIILILTCIVIGMLYFHLFWSDVKTFKPTEKMINIADFKGQKYWNDVVYGFVVGMCVYAAYDNLTLTNANVLAGVAIGITILPAFVNAGIMISAGLHGYTDKKEEELSGEDDEINNLAIYGLSSSSVGIIYLVTNLFGFITARTVRKYFITK